MKFSFGSFFGNERIVPNGDGRPLDQQIQPEPIEEPQETMAVTTFQTSLVLSAEAEGLMIARAKNRIAELRLEMGLGLTGTVESGSWMEKRWRHDQSYQGDYRWRVAMSGIFEHSNFTLGSGMRHVRYMAARIQDDLLGTSPFFGAFAKNPGNEKLAAQIEEAVQADIDRSNVRATLREAQKLALIRNECVVKTTWAFDETPYVGPATVLVNQATGEPVLTQETKEFIYKDDNMLPHPAVQGAVLLEKDPSFMAAPGPAQDSLIMPAAGGMVAQLCYFQEIPDLPQKNIRYEGVQCTPIDYRSFLCPLTVPNIHEADTVVHLMRQSPGTLRAKYGGFNIGERYFSLMDGPGENQAKPEQGEKSNWPSTVYQELDIAEVYMRFDADGDGKDEEIMLVLDTLNDRAIYYNYLHNHMRSRPFEVITGVEKVPSRWYGRGIFGILDDHFLFEDAEFNRANFKNSKNASIRFARRDACEDWNNGLAPVIGDGRVHWLNKSYDAKNSPPIFDVNLYENVVTDLELMNTNRQAGDSVIGAISLQSANQSDFNQSKTATGNQLVQQASDVITKATEQDQMEGITAILIQVVDVSLENMKRTRLALNKKATELVTLNREEIRSLPKNVRLLLTRSRSTQLLNTSAQAIDICERYYATVANNLPMAKRMRDLYIRQLKGLEEPDSDELLMEITEEMVAEWQIAQQQAALAQQQAQAQQPPKKAA